LQDEEQQLPSVMQATGKICVQRLREFFLCCSIINYVILIVWWLQFTQAHDWMNRLLRRWVLLPDEKMDAIQLMGFTLYKLGILLLNIVPFVTLCIVG
jgi:hypothetical protein